MPTNFPAELPPPPIGHQRTNQPKTGRPNQNQQRPVVEFHFSLARIIPSHIQFPALQALLLSAITRREDDPEHLEANLDNEEMGGICALLLNRSFGCSETSQDSSLTGYTTLPHLTSFITQVLYTTGFTNIWALDAIRVLKFMKRRVPQTAGYGLSGH
ncbi:hypothetical protein CC2G_013859 [Coprinopsis cinerea AmutBmut pab1-1]|nr:hypothetical protein CC2G_013859 [Coprinopsis cinerea AmutBmut pab1-1]